MAHKILLPAICFLWLPCLLAAQIDTLAVAKRLPPRLTLLLGLQNQYSFSEMRSLLFGANMALKTSWHLGIQYHCLLVGRLESGNVFELQKGSFDIGLYGERFWNWRFFGKKIPFYLGPEIRLGRRKYKDWYADLSIGKGMYVNYPSRTFKTLARLGLQPRLGKFLVNIALPTGIEFEQAKLPFPKSTDHYYAYANYGTGRAKLIFLPSISLGYTF